MKIGAWGAVAEIYSSDFKQLRDVEALSCSYGKQVIFVPEQVVSKREQVIVAPQILPGTGRIF